MNLNDAIEQLKGSPAVVPECSRDTLPAFLLGKGCRVGAEVGVYKGEYTAKFCQAGLKMFAVDPWKAFGGQGRTQKVQARQDFLYGHTQRVLAQFIDEGLCSVVRKPSMEAVQDFKPGSLDFVYIDGNHEFPAVAQDIYYWSKVVKKGGWIAGHDYFNTIPTASNILCHVRVIVDAYTTLYKIDNWWIFGVCSNGPDTKDGHYYSWMWQNK